MSVFSDVFSFLWSLLDMSVSIGGYSFSLGGAVVFAGLVTVFIAFITWLFGFDD